MDSIFKTFANRFNAARARIWNALGGATQTAPISDELEYEERRMSGETLVDMPILGEYCFPLSLTSLRSVSSSTWRVFKTSCIQRVDLLIPVSRIGTS